MEAELQELRTTKGKTGFKGIIVAKPGTAKPYQARVDDVVTGQKQRPIPGLFKDAEEAARAVIMFVRNGCQWPEKNADRRKRNEVCCSALPFLIRASVSPYTSCAQGPKPRLGSTNGMKKWNKGAPLTKHPKMPGIGRGKHPNSKEAWKLGCKQKVIEGPRDPTLPTTVPMPSAIEDITDAGMRAMWEQSMAMDGEAAPCVEPLD